VFVGSDAQQPRRSARIAAGRPAARVASAPLRAGRASSGLRRDRRRCSSAHPATTGNQPSCWRTEEQLHGLVLWNPVLDLPGTFLEPELPWGLEDFTPGRREALSSRGFLLVDEVFQLGRVLFEEFHTYRPDEAFARSRVPALIVHGDQDTYVSYGTARKAAIRESCDFHMITGSDHGFDSRKREDEAIAVTLDWLQRRYT
jgi:pimeloyl-ACP methyl ester carboxylesterase